MSNGLDELDRTGRRAEGLDVHVIAKQIPVHAEPSAVYFIRGVKFGGPILGVLSGVIVSIICKTPEPLAVCSCMGFFMSLIVVLVEEGTYNNLRRKEQEINTSASRLDNYQQQRVTVTSNMEQIAKEAVKLDKEVFRDVAAARSGRELPDEDRERIGNQVDVIQIVLERYPELRSHTMLQHYAQQDAYLAAQITEARNRHNGIVEEWNRIIFGWPFYQYVADRHNYTTRIPYIASEEVKAAGESVLYHVDDVKEAGNQGGK